MNSLMRVRVKLYIKLSHYTFWHFYVTIMSKRIALWQMQNWTMRCKHAMPPQGVFQSLSSTQKTVAMSNLHWSEWIELQQFLWNIFYRTPSTSCKLEQSFLKWSFIDTNGNSYLTSSQQQTRWQRKITKKLMNKQRKRQHEKTSRTFCPRFDFIPIVRCPVSDVWALQSHIPLRLLYETSLTFFIFILQYQPYYFCKCHALLTTDSKFFYSPCLSMKPFLNVILKL